MADGVHKLRRLIEAEGWDVEDVRRGGHFRCTHPDAAHPVWSPKTPGDRRWWLNFRSELRRSLRTNTDRAAARSARSD